MEVENQFYDIDRLLTRKSYFASEDFEPSVEVNLKCFHNWSRLL